MDTLPDAERFRLDVDSLESALLAFNDYEVCMEDLERRMGREYAVCAALALASRLAGEAA